MDGLTLVMFGYRNFSNGQHVDNVETEKSRIVLYELESDWWILAVSDCNTVRFFKADRLYTVHRPHSNIITQNRQCVLRNISIYRVLLARNIPSSIPNPTTPTCAFDIPTTPWRFIKRSLPTSWKRIVLQTPQSLLEQIRPSLACASQRQPSRGSVQWRQTRCGWRTRNWRRRRRMG